ncbi:hypothetical protein LMG5997_06704 [Achromobacter insolitus]|nr:hypothetical protein LMG5997_06704 [Achromobacter insolitus]
MTVLSVLPAASAMRMPVCTALTMGLLAVSVSPVCLISWNSFSCAVSSAAPMFTSWPISVMSPWRARTLLPVISSALPALMSASPSTLPTVLAVLKTFSPSIQSVCLRVP